MIVVADSGSSKTDWMGTENEETVFQGQTIGLNPVLLSSEEIRRHVQAGLAGRLPWEKVDQLFFYGSGCGSPARQERVREALQGLFPRARVSVEHDLIAAARATCGNEAGIACILGTGSNCCLFDGHRILDQMYSLGYLLGDEGSGVDLAKALIRARYYGGLDAETRDLFDRFLESRTDMPSGDIVDELYRSDSPPRFLASFVPFLVEHRDRSDLRRLIRNRFDRFLSRHVLRYPEAGSWPVHFVGSVAWFFRPILESLLQDRGLQAGRWVRRPILPLLNYHSIKQN